MIGLLAAAAVAGSLKFYTGNDLYEFCRKDNPICLGYVDGVSDLINTQQAATKGSPSVCEPSSVTGGQLKDIVFKYLTDKPALRNQGAAGLVVVALAEAFPCPM